MASDAGEPGAREQSALRVSVQLSEAERPELTADS
jgi:hypothetical protein